MHVPVPLRGVLSLPFRAFGIRPSRMNPNTCTICELMFTRVMRARKSLAAMRNLAAHLEDITVSRQDAEDLQAFVYAITEYVYDLTDRYNEFKEREEEKKKPSQRLKCLPM